MGRILENLPNEAESAVALAKAGGSGKKYKRCHGA
ncbi:MAG TPA: hypothetical protein DIS53_00795 [Candidatus Wildermuthbacteria bacterium]|nr:hypothetical protein [Candidatus Wildermuthbacteria bacterium]